MIIYNDINGLKNSWLNQKVNDFLKEIESILGWL